MGIDGEIFYLMEISQVIKNKGERLNFKDKMGFLFEGMHRVHWVEG